MNAITRCTASLRESIRDLFEPQANPFDTRRRTTTNHSARRLARFGMILAACALMATQAVAALIPNGNPAHNSVQNAALGSAVSAGGQTVSLIPNPAVFMPQGNSPWLLPALNVAAQPYNNATNVWNYSVATLHSDLTLVDYEAWADNSPTVSLGTNTFTGGPAAGRGGAAFVITYNPSPTDIVEFFDPDPSSIRWIQVIDSNMPSDRGVTYGSVLGDGTTIYLDNAASNTAPYAGVDPYYGHLSGFAAANGNGFLDRTNFDLPSSVGLVWEAQAFLSTETSSVAGGITTHNVTIYDGVWWGFKVVPEPGAFVLILSGAGVLIVWSLRRSARRAI